MLGKIIGALIGRRAARQVSGVSDAQGALLGLGMATVLRRLGPAGIVAAAAGAYALKRHREKSKSRKGYPSRSAPSI